MSVMPTEHIFPDTGLPLPAPFFQMLGPQQIHDRIEQMAPVVDRHMRASHQAGHRLTAVSLLNGAVPFFNALHQHTYRGFTPINLHASSYTGTNAGELEIAERVLKPELIADRVVYVKDDLVDGGQTMCEIVKLIEDMGARQVVPISLLDKPEGREEDYRHFSPMLTGFIIPKVWVWGFGMDDGWNDPEWPHDNEWVRMQPGIWVYHEEPDSSQIILPKLEELPLAV